MRIMLKPAKIKRWMKEMMVRKSSITYYTKKPGDSNIYHVAIIYTGFRRKFYLDGTRVRKSVIAPFT